MLENVKEADITFKVRGDQFEFIKIVFLEEKDTCSMKIQEVLFGDFKLFEIPKQAFVDLVKTLDDCTIPFPGYSDGKSGTNYHLEVQSGENAMNFTWFGDSPGEQWKGLVGFSNKLIALKNKYKN